MWENTNELLPTGRGAVPIISSWENTRGKIERQKKREGEMKEDRIFAFLFPLIHHRARALCRSGLLGNGSRRLFGFITLMEGDDVRTHTLLHHHHPLKCP